MGRRLTVAGLVVAGLVFVIGTIVIPVHVSLGAGSLRCGTVLHPDRMSEVGALCGRAAAHHLRAAVCVGAGLAVLALLPALAGRLKPNRQRALWVLWTSVFVLMALMGVALLGIVHYSPPHQVFDL